MVPVDPRGDFGFLVPIKSELTRIPLSATSPKYGVEEETLELSVPDWQAIHRDIQRLPVMREDIETAPPEPEMADRFRTGIGADFATGFYIPYAEFESLLSPRWAVGIRGSYAGTSQSTLDQVGVGVFVNASYFVIPGRLPFQGFFIQPQLGAYRVASSGPGVSSNVQLHPDVSLRAGWRPAMAGPFQLGIGGGVHYVFGNDSNLSYTGFFPGLMFDAGFRF
jgi:hypothetical protein